MHARFMKTLIALLVASSAATAGAAAAPEPPTALRVAVGPFASGAAQGGLGPLGKGFAEMVATDLASAPGLVVVERARLDAVLKELELGASAFMDKSSVQRLGKGLGATHLVVGSFLVEGERLRLDARLVDVSSGEVAATASETGPKDDVFGLEARLVAALARSIAVKFRPPVERPRSFAAFQQFAAGLDALDRGEMAEAQALLKSAAEAGVAVGASRLAALNAKGRLEAEKAEAQVATHLAGILALARRIQKGDLSACDGLLQDAPQTLFRAGPSGCSLGPGPATKESLARMVRCMSEKTWEVAALGRAILEMPAWPRPCPPVPFLGRMGPGYSPEALLSLVLGRLPEPPAPPYSTADMKTFVEFGAAPLSAERGPRQLLDLEIAIIERLLARPPDAETAHERADLGRRLERATGARAELDASASGPARHAKASQELLRHLSASPWLGGSIENGAGLIRIDDFSFDEPQGPVDAKGLVRDISLSVDGGATWRRWPRWKDEAVQAERDGVGSLGFDVGAWRRKDRWCPEVDVQPSEAPPGTPEFLLAEAREEAKRRLVDGPVTAPRNARFAIRLTTVDGGSVTCKIKTTGRYVGTKCAAPTPGR